MDVMVKMARFQIKQNVIIWNTTLDTLLEHLSEVVFMK